MRAKPAARYRLASASYDCGFQMSVLETRSLIYTENAPVVFIREPLQILPIGFIQAIEARCLFALSFPFSDKMKLH